MTHIGGSLVPAVRVWSWLIYVTLAWIIYAKSDDDQMDLATAILATFVWVVAGAYYFFFAETKPFWAKATWISLLVTVLCLFGASMDRSGNDVGYSVGSSIVLFASVVYLHMFKETDFHTEINWKYGLLVGISGILLCFGGWAASYWQDSTGWLWIVLMFVAAFVVVIHFGILRNWATGMYSNF